MTIAETAHHEVHPNQVTAWRTQVLENLAAIFGDKLSAEDGKERIRELHEKIEILGEVFGDPLFSQNDKVVLDRFDFWSHWRRPETGASSRSRATPSPRPN
jgi:hypothetical protein